MGKKKNKNKPLVWSPELGRMTTNKIVKAIASNKTEKKGK